MKWFVQAPAPSWNLFSERQLSLGRFRDYCISLLLYNKNKKKEEWLPCLYDHSDRARGPYLKGLQPHEESTELINLESEEGDQDRYFTLCGWTAEMDRLTSRIARCLRMVLSRYARPGPARLHLSSGYLLFDLQSHYGLGDDLSLSLISTPDHTI